MSQPSEVVLHLKKDTDELPTPDEIEKVITDYLTTAISPRDHWHIKNAVTVPYTFLGGLFEFSVTTIVIEREV